MKIKVPNHHEEENVELCLECCTVCCATLFSPNNSNNSATNRLLMADGLAKGNLTEVIAGATDTPALAVMDGEQRGDTTEEALGAAGMGCTIL